MKNLFFKFFKRIKIIFNFILDPYSNLYWSQEGEDILIKRIFANKNKGFYVDVGAHHSQRFSNTYKLYNENNWRGINIEPSIKLFNNLKKRRNRDTNINLGVSDKSEILKFNIFEDEALNTFNIKKKNALKNKYNLKMIKDVQCERLGDILDKVIKKRIIIDLLNIDAEGNDLKVLKSNNWKKYKPYFIIVEISSLTLDDIIKNPITKFLKTKKYRIYSKLHKSVIFKLNKKKYD